MTRANVHGSRPSRRLRQPILVLGSLLAAALIISGPADPATTARPAVVTHPQIRVGGFPTGIALNPLTGTIYVGNGTTQTLSLINGKTCNAGNASGCRQHITAVTAGTDPIGVAVDGVSNTVYAVNSSGTVAVVDGGRCDATDATGCRAAPTTVPVGKDPQFLLVDAKTRTVYVANTFSNTVSVIDAATCNAALRTGCRRPRASIPVGPGPFTLAVNDKTDTLYVTDLGAPIVSVVDTKTCNAQAVGGCGRIPATVNVGERPGGIAIDTSTDTIYVTGQGSSDVSVIDGKTCNAHRRSGCRAKPIHTFAGAGARGIAVNEATDTIYVANTDANTVSVIDGATCNAAVSSGCRRQAAVAPVGISPRRVAVDELTNTVYITNAGSNSVTMLNGRTCNGHVHSGCGRASAAPAPGSPRSGTAHQPPTNTTTEPVI